MREIKLPKKAADEFREIARREWGREMSENEARATAEWFLATLANAFRNDAPERVGMRPEEPYVPSAPRRCSLCLSVKRSEPVTVTERGALCAHAPRRWTTAPFPRTS